MTLDAIVSLIAILLMGYGTWWVIKWFFNTGTKQTGNNADLSPADLRALEETTRRLMDDLRVVTDECVQKIEIACELAQKKIADTKIQIDAVPAQQLRSADSSAAQNRISLEVSECEISEPSNPTESIHTVASFAKSAGLTTGEVELMRGLRNFEKSSKA